MVYKDLSRGPGPLVPEQSTGTSKVLFINARLNSLRKHGAGHTEQDTFTFEKLLHSTDDLRKPGLPELHVRHLGGGLEMSSDQGGESWRAIADVIEAEYHYFDGFVVHYGTETMVYAATALSYMLENLGKPVMFTGSLIPANEVHSDMKRNIILAMMFAQNKDICEVCIVFAERLFRANRTCKISRSSLQPFVSPNMPALAELRGDKVRLEKRLLHRAPTGRLRVHKDMSALILTIRLLPGTSTPIAVRMATTTRARAIIIVAFGSGNVPSLRQDAVLRVAQIAKRRDILVVVCTQNRYGTIEPSIYASGMRLVSEGAVGAGDMTIEATILKLKYLFGRGRSADEIRACLLQNLRGEVSEEQSARLLSNL